VSYAGVSLPNISEIHKLGLENSTQHDNTCLTGPAVQIIGETKCFGKGKNCINLIKGANAPSGTYFVCQGGIHTCYPGGDFVLVFLVPDPDILPGTEVAQHLNQQTDGWTHFWWDPILLQVLLGVSLAGATATGATAIGLQQVQLSTTKHCHPTKSVRLTSSRSLAKPLGLVLIIAEKGEFVHF
jgi:hypothetical protein